MEKNRKNQTAQGQKNLKPKFIDNKNHTKTNVQTNGRVMLTDLCPEQKAKIGQLIKTLQQRKKQNEDLNCQLSSWKSNYSTLQKVKIQLQNLIETKNKQFKKINAEIQLLNHQKVQKDIQVHELHLQLQKQMKLNKSTTSKTNFGMNTIKIQTTNSSTQTKDKKRKQKSKQIQVNTILQLGGLQQRQTRKNSFYQPNSKSFDKIMNGQRLRSSSKKQYETAVFGQDQTDHVNSNGKPKINQPSRRQSSNFENKNEKKSLQADQLNDYKNWSEYGQQNQNIQNLNEENIQIQDTENDDDQFQMLAKKWLELKQKNIQQMTQGYFHNENQQHFNSNDKNLEIQSKMYKNNHVQDCNLQEGSMNEDQLNKALKSRDFSASRLLNSKSKANISQNSGKKSLQNSHSSYRNQRSQIINKQKSSIAIPQKKALRSKNAMEQSSKGVDFYSADLMDLVEEINR